MKLFCTGATTSQSLNEDFLKSLEDIEKQFPPRSEQTAWEKRRQNLEENWANSRSHLLHSLMFRETVPVNVNCCKCRLQKSVVHCTTCSKLMCSECDSKVHSKYAFHNRQAWLNGYYEGIPNNHSVVDDVLVPVGKI